MNDTKKPKVGAKYYRGKRNVTPEFLTGGHATFSIGRKNYQYTYKVSKHVTLPKFNVFLLSGPDNTRDFTRIGQLDTSAVKRKMFTLIHDTHYTKDSPCVDLFIWALDIILNDRFTPTGYSIVHIGKCGVCGRRLSKLDSIDIGIGRVCLEKTLSNKQ